jgi:soluble lytic murein transglycosylase-like protein
LLTEVAKRTHAKTLVVVFTFDPPRAPEVRLFDPATSVFGNTHYLAENGGWQPLVSALVAMNAPPAPSASASANLGKKDDAPFYKSPWFWGSVGVAAVVSVIVILAFSHTSTSSSSPVELKW